jgi:hypothetical protein
MNHTNEDHTANAKRSCVTFATRGIPDKESSAGGAVVLNAQVQVQVFTQRPRNGQIKLCNCANSSPRRHWINLLQRQISTITHRACQCL